MREFEDYLKYRIKESEVVVTYVSPFTGLPVMVETETHKYLIAVKK